MRSERSRWPAAALLAAAVFLLVGVAGMMDAAAAPERGAANAGWGEIGVTPEPIVLREDRRGDATTVTIEIPAGADTFTSSGMPNTNFSSDSNLRVGFNVPQGLGAERMFLFFDVGSIPGNAVVQSATLRVYLNSFSPTGDVPMGMLARFLNSAWDVSTLTWNNYNPAWQAEIGLGQISATTGWIESGITDPVADWVSGERPNYGIMIQGDETPQQRERVFTSLNSGNGLHPRLVVTYTTPVCYTLTLTHSGDGSDPAANPANSPGCVAGQYTAGELITLTAFPGGGWRVGGWLGTNDDASKNYTNAVTMPAADHSAGPIYEPDEITCYYLTLSHTGQGSDPTAEPSHSGVCGAGQFDSEHFITVTAAPAAGWRVAGWSGTINDAGTTTTNSLTMPADHHTVSVTYEPIPAATHRLFAPAILYRPVICFVGPNEQELNNNRDQANGPLCNGQAYRGWPQDDYDVFYFVMPAAGPIAIELDDFAAAGGQLGLLSADFVPIAYDVTPGDGFRISRANEPAGRYYIVVHTPAPDTGAGMYGLRVTFAARQDG